MSDNNSGNNDGKDVHQLQSQVTVLDELVDAFPESVASVPVFRSQHNGAVIEGTYVMLGTNRKATKRQ